VLPDQLARKEHTETPVLQVLRVYKVFKVQLGPLAQQERLVQLELKA
jgi:hypothetical protein